MRLVSITDLRAGMVVAKSTYMQDGRLLLGEDVELSDRLIEKVKNSSLGSVYIKDDRVEDFVINENIPEPLKRQAANALENSFRPMKTKKDNSQLVHLEMKPIENVLDELLDEVRGLDGLLELIANTYHYDLYVFSHSVNVALYSLMVGKEIKLTPKKLKRLGMSALLHDIGKMMAPVDILNKPGALTDEEYETIKKHAQNGYDILSQQMVFSPDVLRGVAEHHERLDGSGYPKGLTEDEIHLFGKIIAIADVYDAMTSHRVYRDPMLPQDVLEFLLAGATKLFDPELVKAFNRSVAIYPKGVTVQLSTGEVGVVIENHYNFPLRPKVLVIENASHVSLDQPKVCDLVEREHLTTFIVGCESMGMKSKESLAK
ncbi:hypothetical protein CEY16_00610 [Halalkalibacillus sediminis]|uniref:Uncharacterized protein n=1 Tax=Halalkalibacillus sediminis TaxID=2018042 RepID=A0A2I0QVB9_9BACI|nr:HD-GYP domain-containing protein [Halalkalibacillus sediminis]PKR78293.1 hypothetical protein CEY16_00610 [Halalkalibacillus sediminis]